MTSLDPDGVTVPALGKQAQSARRTAPTYGMSKVPRSRFESVYISEGHTRTARLGRESPVGGPVYDLPSTMGSLSITFGTGNRDINKLRRTSTRNKPGEYAIPGDHPDDIPTNDALDINVDSQPFKFRREPHIIVGTDPRGKLKDAELIKNHSSAFYGRQSPGPAAIGDAYGPSLGPTKPTFAPARPFGIRTKINWMKCGDNPPGVGPGVHDRNDNSIGQQHLSKRRNQSVHGFPKEPKFPKNKYQDSVSVLDAARSCMGRQVLGKNRSEPSVGFSADSRGTREKTMVCYTRKDEGPRAALPKFTASMPRLPSEPTIMASGLG
mmetsp:Transcript_55362/g.161596  ORF Transcript_55362/g.161596 Transcript_55362/m.161596 type:complete len:323 (-) Transcript_55362:748-1716(-)